MSDPVVAQIPSPLWDTTIGFLTNLWKGRCQDSYPIPMFPLDYVCSAHRHINGVRAVPGPPIGRLRTVNVTSPRDTAAIATPCRSSERRDPTTATLITEQQLGNDEEARRSWWSEQQGYAYDPPTPSTPRPTVAAADRSDPFL